MQDLSLNLHLRVGKLDPCDRHVLVRRAQGVSQIFYTTPVDATGDRADPVGVRPASFDRDSVRDSALNQSASVTGEQQPAVRTTIVRRQKYSALSAACVRRRRCSQQITE